MYKAVVSFQPFPGGSKKPKESSVDPILYQIITN